MKYHGEEPIEAFQETYPTLRSFPYDPGEFDVAKALEGVDLAIVHEWNDPQLVFRIGRHRRAAGHFKLLFHDTHHRSVTEPESMAMYDLSHYDGVLAFGETVREVYRRRRWARRVWTWHEAADTRVFRRGPSGSKDGDLIWIGNWGDGERTYELKEFLLQPVKQLRLKAKAHGVRYPKEGRVALRDAGMAYGGWLPNFQVPSVFNRYRVTVHVPRRPYVEALPGIPTIRPFEVLACGIPLICSPWEDSEGLFGEGSYLVARDGREMLKHLRAVLEDEGLAQSLSIAGRKTIEERHTCAHRVDELLNIYHELEEECVKAPARCAC